MQYEIRAMSLGEVLDTAFRLLRDHFGRLVGIALVVSVPTSLIAVFAAEMVTSADLGASVGLLGLGLFLVVISPIISATITHVISEVYLGRPAGFATSLKVGLGLLLPLLGTALLMMLLIAGGFLLLILPGLYLTFAFMLTYQVVVIEEIAGWPALKRTYELSKGHLLRILGVYLVAMLVMMVLSSGSGFLNAVVPHLGTLLDTLIQAVFTAYYSAAFVVLYFDIRCRKEAFDLDHLARLVREEPGAAAIAH